MVGNSPMPEKRLRRTSPYAVKQLRGTSPSAFEKQLRRASPPAFEGSITRQAHRLLSKQPRRLPRDSSMRDQPVPQGILRGSTWLGEIAVYLDKTIFFVSMNEPACNR